MKKKIILTVMGVLFLSSAAMAQRGYDSYDDNHMGYRNDSRLTNEQYDRAQEERSQYRNYGHNRGNHMSRDSYSNRGNHMSRNGYRNNDGYGNHMKKNRHRGNGRTHNSW